MTTLKRWVISAAAIAMVSCAGPPSKTIIDAALSGDPERIARTVIEEQLQRQGMPPDLEGIPELVEVLGRLLRDVWGEREPEIASEHRYVKYTGNFEARAIVDFDANRDRALSRINTMSSSAVYARIVANHPFRETRRYLEKVRAAERRYLQR